MRARQLLSAGVLFAAVGLGSFAAEPTPEKELLKAKGLTQDDAKQIAKDREAFQKSTEKDSIEKSKVLLKWVQVGDRHEWVTYVFGSPARKINDTDWAYQVPGQDFIIFQIEDGKIKGISRIWRC